MITKLIALLTLLFAPLHISNNIVKDGAGQKCEALPSRPQETIVKDGAGQKCEALPSRPQETNLREIKQARDYNEYYGNNSFNILTSYTSLKDNYVFSADSNTNSMTFMGNLGNDVKQVNYNVKCSDIVIDNISSFYYFKLEVISGDYYENTEIEIELIDIKTGIKSYIYQGVKSPTLFVYNGDMNGTFRINYIGLIGMGNYYNFNFSFYIFSPINNNNYVPPGIIYTETQVNDIVDDYEKSNNSLTFPLYNSSYTYTNLNETIGGSGLIPTHYNYFTFQELYDIIEPSLNGEFLSSCTITITFNSGILARDLILVASYVNNIQIYQTDNVIFYEQRFMGAPSNFDLSTLSLNDTQKNKSINKVVLKYDAFRSTDGVALNVENKTNSFSYQMGFDSGKQEGEKIGYNNGYTNGTRDGYNNGYEVGRNENIANKNYNAFTLVSTAFSSIGKLLNVEIYNGLTIGVIVCIPIIFCVVLFVIKMIKG